MNEHDTIFSRLMAVIQQRRSDPPTRSYTATLYAGGVERIGAKVMEEAAEAVQAASQGDREHLVHEAADLIYHLFVLLGYHGIQLEEVQAELARRFGTGGLDEKAARPAPSGGGPPP